jgi:S-adenosylmethionine/arginine decarboxylase-like enzyme
MCFAVVQCFLSTFYSSVLIPKTYFVQLNEGGVMVKNELYMNDMSKTFDYTLQIHLDENPKICSQCMAFGSNRADFFHQPIKDQNVTTLLLPPVAELKDRFDFFHDYRKNNAKKAGKCDLSSRKEEENDEQGKSAGILHVLDAENVTITLDSSSVEKMILEVGKEEGLTPVSISTNRPDGIVSEMVVVVFKEGYVLARLWPEYSYCAIDIGLWGGFLREASFHKRLAKAMNPKTLSSFRVIVGGMYGSSTWREDKKVIGPQLVQHRDCDVPEPKDVEFSDDAAKRVTVNEITNLAASSKIVAAVICGVKDKDDCISVDVLDKNPKVAKLVPIWTCPDLLDEAEGPQTLMRKFECEENTISAIQESLGPDERFDIVILDASTPLVMGQIMNSILSVRRYQSELLNDYNIFFAWSNKPKTESWQRNFLERYRKDIKYDPITRVEMQITVDDETMEVGLVSCGDLAVFYNVNVLEKKLNKRLQREGTSAKAEVVNLTGGMFRYQHDYNPREFLHSDYDSEPGDKQYAEQKPIGREMILQLELNDEMDNAEMPSWESMTHMVQALFAAMKYEVTRSESYTNIGDGALLVTAFKEGNAVLVWDGRNHIDVNLFLFDDRKELADTFASKLTHFTENNLKVALRDDFPRGFGRVVNFKDDLGFTYDSVPRRPYVE